MLVPILAAAAVRNDTRDHCASCLFSMQLITSPAAASTNFALRMIVTLVVQLLHGCSRHDLHMLHWIMQLKPPVSSRPSLVHGLLTHGACCPSMLAQAVKSC